MKNYFDIKIFFFYVRDIVREGLENDARWIFFIWMLFLPLMTLHIEWAKRYLQISEISPPPNIRAVKEGLPSRGIFYYNKSYTQFHKLGKLGTLFPKKGALKATSELSSPIP